MTRIYLVLIFHLIISITSTSQFSEETIKFSISEDAPINTILGRLSPEKRFTYRLSRGNSKIKFDEITLELSTSSQLDRESENAIDMLIITSPPSIIHVLIEILDINDNPPKFPIEVQRIEIPETAPIGWRVQISGATDPDNGRNGTIDNYGLELEDVEAPFRIVQENDGFVFLEVTGKLDRETRDVYSIRLVATDQGTPKLSATCLLNIEILDINDNAPDFAIRNLEIDWNGQPGQVLFDLNATDLDSAENSKITYSIRGPAHQTFEIRNGTQLVTRNDTLGYCSPRCEIVVEARDSGVPPLTSTLNIVVKLEYGNEHEPNINIRFYPSDFPFIIVQPDDVNGKTLAILTLTDPDGPLGANSSIWIENGNSEGIFSLISRQSINILTLKNVDFAKRPKYRLEFGATDNQKPSEKKTSRILDVFFKKNVEVLEYRVKKEFHVAIERTTVAGSFVVLVETNCTGNCGFELLENQNLFRIDESNGIIVTSSPLPDDVTSYHLPIRIRLPPPNTKFLETDVFVKILSDSAPKSLIRKTAETTVIHLKRAYTFATWQNVTVGTVIGRLPTSQVYSTKDHNSELGVFPDGSIFVGKSVKDKEVLNLEVILEQNNTTQTSLITVLLRKINSSPPTCPSELSLRIPEDVPIGTRISRLHAEDPDTDVVSYRLLNSDDDVVHLESSTGNLIVKKTLDAEKRGNYSFSFEAKDYGTPSKTSICTGTLFIDDVNDNPPKFTSKFYISRISGAANSTVTIVHASDDDVTERNRRIEYRLLNFHDDFQIDRDSGKISTIREIQNSNQKRINLTVVAVNLDSESESESFVLIHVENSNSGNSNLTVRIFKDDVPGQKIGRIEVTSSGFLKSLDSRFFVNSHGFIILNSTTSSSSSDAEADFFEVTSSDSDVGKIRIHVEHVDSERDDETTEVLEITVEKNQTGEILSLSNDWKNWKIGRTIGDVNSENKFLIENQKLKISGNLNLTSDVHIFLESGDNSKKPIYKIIHVSIPIHKTSSCSFRTAHLITPPATVTLPENCGVLKIEKSPNLQIHESQLLIPFQTDVICHVALNSDVEMTLIRDVISEDVKFTSSEILMLVSSIHELTSSFGRVTAESGFRIRYFIVGRDSEDVSINSDSGELFLKRRIFRNLEDVTVLAVVPNGIAKTKVTIEVIEDRLVLPKSNFLLIPKSPRLLDSPIGNVSTGRDDVIIDVIDDNFFVRKNEIFAKKNSNSNFAPDHLMFYEFGGFAKKGKLRAPVNFTVFFGNSKNSGIHKNGEIHLEMEKEMPVGTAIGVVPNYLSQTSSTYRLIDQDPGIKIDKSGVFRISKIPKESEMLNLKMIDAVENSIWKIRIFIFEKSKVPKILNPPTSIRLGEEFRRRWIQNPNVTLWKFDVENSEFDSEDVKIKNGDFYGNLRISNSGILRIQNWPSESFNVTLGFPNSNSEDVRIRIHVAQSEFKVGCRNSEFWIFENPKNRIIGRIEKSDVSNSQMTFRIVPEKLPRGFSIDPLTGDLQMRNSEFSEFSETYFLKIQVISFDGGQSGYCNSTIHVADDVRRSEAPPTFRNGSRIEFEVQETTSRGTAIGQIQLLEDSEDVVFRILDDFNFTISPFDGVIFTNSPLDFEEIQIYKIHVIATRMTSSSESHCDVIIHVIDENDEAPRFITGDVVNLRVLEDVIEFPMVIGSSIAEDSDDGKNGVVTYSIVGGNTTLFAVNSTNGEILLLNSVDREVQDLYELKIEAKDSGLPALSATSLIRIHVDDVNDNSPEFPVPWYHSEIPEDLEVGSRILQIHAEDRDQDPKLQYSLDTVVPFRCDAITGWITVAGRLQSGDYLMNATVTDEGQRTARITVEIVVVKKRKIDGVKFRDSDEDVVVPSEVPRGFLIHVVDVDWSEDSGNSENLKFSISNSSNFEISEFGEIFSKTTVIHNGNLTITVSDGLQESSREIRLRPLSGSAHFPIWTEKIDKISVREHENLELAIFRTNREKDRFSIFGKCEDDFEIGEETGILRVRSSLDREVFPECVLFIVATSSENDLRIFQKLVVKIIDVNDNSPKFEKSKYEFSAIENSGPQKIGKVTATDLDAGENSRIFYEVVRKEEDEIQNLFDVNENGEVLILNSLDREVQSEYFLEIQAIDNSNKFKPSSEFSKTIVHIRILDEDDNPPRFSRIFHVDIPEDVAIGTEVIRLSASDSDDVANHQFEFENSEDVIPFEVERTSGIVRVNQTLDFEKKSSYRIKVRLTDGAWLIETSLFVNLIDVNDNVPIFEETDYFFVSNESPVIGKVKATDLDSGLNGEIRYSLKSPYFRIDPKNGILVRLRPLLTAVTKLEVFAEDLGIPRHQRSTVVTVAEENLFQKRNFKIRKNSTKIGNGFGFSETARVSPRGSATVTHDGNLNLSLAGNSNFWVLDKTVLYSFEFSNSSKSNFGNLEFLKIPKNGKSKIQIPGCSNYRNLGPAGNSNFRIGKNGNLRIFANNLEKIDIQCDDGILPVEIRNFTIFLKNGFLENEESESEDVEKRKINFSKNEKMEIRISENSGPGTILWNNEANVPIWLARNSKIQISRGNLILKEKIDAILEFEVFDGNFERTQVTVIPVKDASSCPIFSKNFYFFEIFENATEIFDFGWKMEDIENCKMEIENENLLFHVINSSLLPLQNPTPSGTFQFEIRIFENSNSNSIRSKTQVTVEVQKSEIQKSKIPKILFLEDLDYLKTWNLSIQNFKESGKKTLKKIPISQNSDFLRIFLDDVASSEPPEDSEVFQKNSWNSEDVREAVQLEIYAFKSSIPRLLARIRQTYPDMQIRLLGISQESEDVKYTIILNILNRNNVVVKDSESEITLTSFFAKNQNQFSDLEFIGFRGNPCRKIYCPGNSKCQNVLTTSSEDVLDAKLLGKCDLGFSEVAGVQKIDCGKSGVLETSSEFCKCPDGIESRYSCDLIDSMGFSTEHPSSFEVSAENRTLLNCDDGCDVEKIQMDFRTRMENFEIMRFGLAKIEILSGSLVFSISGSHPSQKISAKIERPRISDGRWHRLLIQMSDDGRKIQIQIDGRGKEIKSRVAIPMMYSEGVKIFTSSELCLRRIVAQNQWIHPEFPKSRVFRISKNSEFRISQCSRQNSENSDSENSFLFDSKNLTTLILLSGLSIISLIALALGILAIFRRRRQKTSDAQNGWKKTSEIIQGHVRHDPGYDNYKAEMKSSTSTDVYTTSTSSNPRLHHFRRRDGHVNMAYL